MERLFDLYPPTEFSLLGVILGLPLLGAFINGVFGKRLGRHGVRATALMVMGLAFLAAVAAFGDGTTYAQQFFLQKLAPAIRTVLTTTDGPFADFRGEIDEINHEKGKIKVLVSFFGRETPVELDFLQAERET